MLVHRLNMLFVFLLASLFLAGCLGGGGGGPAAFNAELMVTISEEDTPESMAGQGLTDVRFYEAGTGAGALEAEVLWTPGSYQISGLTGNPRIEPRLAGYTFVPPDAAVSQQNPAVSFVAVPDGAMAEAQADAEAAVGDGSVENLFVTGELQDDLSAQRLVNLHLWGGSVPGMAYHADEAGQLHLLGSGSILGNLSVNTPSASVYNALRVNGDVIIEAVSGSSWDEHAEDNRLVVQASDTEVRLHRGAESVTVTGGGNTIIVGGPLSKLSVIDALGETNILGAHHIGYLEADGSTVYVDSEPQDGDDGYIVLDAHILAVQEVVSGLRDVMAMGPSFADEVFTVLDELESLFEDTEVLEHALWLLGETAAPLLSDDFFKDSSPTDEDREAWSATSESGVKVTYETDNAEGLLALRDQLMGMFAGGQSDWEHEGNINLFIEAEDKDGFSVEGRMTIDMPQSGDQYSLQDLQNIWMELELKSPCSKTITVEGHLATEFSNGLTPQKIGINGTVSSPWFSTDGTLMAELMSIEDEIHPERVLFDGAMEIDNVLEFDGHIEISASDTPPIHPRSIYSQGARLSFLNSGTVLALDSLNVSIESEGTSINLHAAVGVELDGEHMHIDTQVQVAANNGDWDTGGRLEVQSMVLEHSSGLSLTCTEGTLQVTEDGDDMTIEAAFSWETPDDIRLAIEWDPASNTLTGRMYDSTGKQRADMMLMLEDMVLVIDYDNGQSEEIQLMP